MVQASTAAAASAAEEAAREAQAAAIASAFPLLSSPVRAVWANAPEVEAAFSDGDVGSPQLGALTERTSSQPLQAEDTQRTSEAVNVSSSTAAPTGERKWLGSPKKMLECSFGESLSMEGAVLGLAIQYKCWSDQYLLLDDISMLTLP